MLYLVSMVNSGYLDSNSCRLCHHQLLASRWQRFSSRSYTASSRVPQSNQTTSISWNGAERPVRIPWHSARLTVWSWIVPLFLVDRQQGDGLGLTPTRWLPLYPRLFHIAPREGLQAQGDPVNTTSTESVTREKAIWSSLVVQVMLCDKCVWWECSLFYEPFSHALESCAFTKTTTIR